MDFIEFRVVSYDGDDTGKDTRLEYRCRVAELGVGGGLQFGEWGPWKSVNVIHYQYWDEYCRHCEEVDGTASPTGYG